MLLLVRTLPVISRRTIVTALRGSAQKVRRRSFCNMEPVSETERHMSAVSQALATHAGVIRGSLNQAGWAQVDGLLGGEMIETMRAEAVSLRREGHFAVSQSSRYDAGTQRTVVYEKNGVEAMQLDGGDQYWIAPRMHEYVVETARSLSALINAAESDANNLCARAALDGSHAGNKLAVCLGEGSAYDKHYDNAGGTDTRKLTAILYLNMRWRTELGGNFRMWQQNETAEGLKQGWHDIEPRGDRLLVFWADRCVHSVQPSWTPDGEDDHRYALTVWLPTLKGTAGIERDAAAEAYHFPH